MNVNKPQFLTFTGVDDKTSIDGMVELGRHYPIEWGVLMSKSQQGLGGRYPSEATVRVLTSEPRLRLAAHVCGAWSRDLLQYGWIQDLKPILSTQRFKRIQVNIPDGHHISIVSLTEWAEMFNAKLILQCRGAFPMESHCDWLFDQSGGAGNEPSFWPLPVGPDYVEGRLYGYAGGIKPENVAAVIRIVRQAPLYWLDMESGIRTKDVFDLEKCRKVCEAVYG